MTRPRGGYSLAHVLGACLRAYRVQADPPMPIEVVARSMREHGHAWTKATLLSIEQGRRELALGEWLTLPTALGLSSHSALCNFLPREYGTATIWIGPAFSLQGELALRAYLEGGARAVNEAYMSYPKLELIRALNNPARQAKTKRTLEIAGDAERQAAARLHINPSMVVTLAHRRWRKSLTEERDARLLADPAHTALSPVGRQRKLGHITRLLVKELLPERTRIKKQAREVGD